MPFKFYSFIPGEDNELNYARPGSPPAFFSLPSPVSPHMCGNCIPSITAGAATITAATVAAPLEDMDSQSFDANLQAEPSGIISTHATGVEVRTLSFESLKEELTGCRLDMNQEVVKVILECQKDAWKNQELLHLVDGYFGSGLQTLDLYTVLETCLKRARDAQLLIRVVLQHFDEEDRREDGENEGERYARTLEELRRFKAAGDPFTEKFFQDFQSVYRQHLLMLQNLQLQRTKLDKKLRSGYQLWMNYLKEVKGQKEVVTLMKVSTFIVIKDLDNIRFLISFLECLESGIGNLTELATKGDEAGGEGIVRLAVEEIRKKLSAFREKMDTLQSLADMSSRNVRRARTVVLQRMIRNPKS